MYFYFYNIFISICSNMGLIQISFSFAIIATMGSLGHTYGRCADVLP
jgi:hypothetical protein